MKFVVVIKKNTHFDIMLGDFLLSFSSSLPFILSFSFR